MANSITVRIGELARPLKVMHIKAGTTLSGFLASKKMKMGDNVLVNARKVAGNTRLKNGDLITTMGHVAGGRGR